MSEETTTVDLDKIPATRQQVSRLYFAGLLDREARLHAFELLNPRRLWKLWASRLLLVLGAALILTGIIFFFAANWNSFSGLVKLAGIEFGLVLCLASAWLYGLERQAAQSRPHTFGDALGRVSSVSSSVDSQLIACGSEDSQDGWTASGARWRRRCWT